MKKSLIRAGTTLGTVMILITIIGFAATAQGHTAGTKPGSEDSVAAPQPTSSETSDFRLAPVSATLAPVTKSIITALDEFGVSFEDGAVDSALADRREAANSPAAKAQRKALAKFSAELDAMQANGQARPPADDEAEALTLPSSSELSLNGTSPGDGFLRLTVHDFNGPIPEELTWADDQPVLTGGELVREGGPEAPSIWQDWSIHPETNNPIYELEAHDRRGMAAVRMELPNGRASNPLKPGSFAQLVDESLAAHG